MCAARFDVNEIEHCGSQRELWRYRSKDAAHNARDHFARADPFRDKSTVAKTDPGSEWDAFAINEDFQEVSSIFLAFLSFNFKQVSRRF